MTSLALIAIAALVCLLLGVGLRRSLELFCLRVRNGSVLFVRGRMPQALLDDIAEVVRTPAVARARLRAVRQQGRAALLAEGDLSQDQLQRLRNVLGRYPMQRILSGGRPGRRAGG